MLSPCLEGLLCPICQLQSLLTSEAATSFAKTFPFPSFSSLKFWKHLFHAACLLLAACSDWLQLLAVWQLQVFAPSFYRGAPLPGNPCPNTPTFHHGEPFLCSMGCQGYLDANMWALEANSGLDRSLRVDKFPQQSLPASCFFSVTWRNNGPYLRSCGKD